MILDRHPLVAPAPRLARPLTALARRLVLANVGDLPAGRGRLDVRFPDSRRVTLGRGPRPDATITLHDGRALARMLVRGELGAGEAYVAGEWDADDLPGALRLFLRATAARGVESPLTRIAALPALLRHRLAGNSRGGSARNIPAHYDLGNDFYRTFLDAQLVYSCALWANAATLEDAQRAKLDRLCDLAGLAPGSGTGPAAGAARASAAAPHLLELGCGWGALAAHAARRGARVTAVTLSPAQLAHARAVTAALPVELALRDYRDVTGTYDAILSCEMLEAIGERYLPAFFATIAARLRRGGRAVIQSITMPDERYPAYRRSVDWMQTYVFPGSHIPSLAAIRAAAAGAGLQLLSAASIGEDYAPTLAAWRDRFAAALPSVRALGFDEPFIRTWSLYLAFSEAAFAERFLDVHQLVMSHAR